MSAEKYREFRIEVDTILLQLNKPWPDPRVLRSSYEVLGTLLIAIDPPNMYENPIVDAIVDLEKSYGKSVNRTGELEERCVAFIDIWGFANDVRATTNDKEACRALLALIDSENLPGPPTPGLDRFRIIGNASIGLTSKSADELIRAAPRDHSALVRSTFSDSIVISGSLDQVYEVAWEAKLIEKHFLTNGGRFVRGGIACGLLVHDENVLFGPGILEAYRLENEVAYYPRIVVEDRVASLLDAKARAHCALSTDEDSITFLSDWVGHFVPPIPLPPEKFEQAVFGKLARIREAIDKGLVEAKSTRNPGLQRRYEWLRAKYAETEAELKTALSDPKWRQTWKEIQNPNGL